MSEYTDISTIIDGIRAKRPEALRALYRNYSGAINGILTKMIANPEVAKEALQDCFMRYWNRIDLYDDTKGRPFTWMAQIARNIAKDKLKSKSYRQASKTQSIDSLVSNNEIITDHTEIKIEDIGVAGLKNLLRTEEGIIIDYIYFKGYNQRELSEALDIPLGTVKTRLRMAVKNLRKQLGINKK